MKSGDGSDMEAPSLEFIRRFQNMLDEDDEADYKVVSSTRQRLDHLLSSKDQVIDVSKPSRIRRPTEESGITASFSQSLQDNAFTFASVLSIFIFYRFWKRRKHQPKTIPTTRSKTTEGSSSKDVLDNDSNPQQPKLREAKSSDETTGHANRLTSTKNQEMDGDSEVPDLQAEDIHKSQDSSGTNVSNVSLLAYPATTPAIELDIATSLVQTNNLDATSQIIAQSGPNDDDNIRLYTKIARDIKLAEDVLTENGVERSLAQQLAVSMKTSQAVMESQRQLETQRMMIDSHHRNLDRQLSQRQHEESMHATKYDPNWKEKLEKKRDKCWSATTRIVFEVLVIHYLSMILKPVMESFSSESYLSLGDLGRLAIYSICDCGSFGDKIVSSSATASLFSTSGSLFLRNLLGLDYFVAMDTGLCYGYCLVSFGCTAVLTASIHQGLRIVAAPSLLHQLVNVVALASLFGGPNLWHSQHLSMDALFTFCKIHLLGTVLLSIYALVQWNYSSCKNRVQQGCKSPATFSTSLERSLEQLDTLYSHLCLFRYAMVAIFCASLFVATN